MKSIQGQNNPDKALKPAIAAARQSGQGAKRAQGMVVAASLAATMVGWAFFSHEDAQPESTADQETPIAVVSTAEQSTGEVVSPMSTATLHGTTTVSDTTIQATPTTSSAIVVEPATDAITTQSSLSGSAPQAIARTRSSH